MSGIRTKASYSQPEFCAKQEEKREAVLMSCRIPHVDYFKKKKMVLGQNLQYEGRALVPVFIYLYTICTDFFILKMKDARKHRSYCLLVLFWYWGV